MSYEPTILVLKKDLDKHKDLILYGDWQYPTTKEGKKDEKTRGGEDNQTVMETIKWVYENHDVISVGGIELILFTPLFGQFNKKVRDKLDELEIEYGLDN